MTLNVFARTTHEYHQVTGEHSWKMGEIDPQTGKVVRESVPPWFEESEGGTIVWSNAELMPAPPGAEQSPLGVKDGMLGWKPVQRRDGNIYGAGIDGRRWDKPGTMSPFGMLGNRAPAITCQSPTSRRAEPAAIHSGIRPVLRSSRPCRISDATTPMARLPCCRLYTGIS